MANSSAQAIHSNRNAWSLDQVSYSIDFQLMIDLVAGALQSDQDSDW